MVHTVTVLEERPRPEYIAQKLSTVFEDTLGPDDEVLTLGHLMSSEMFDICKLCTSELVVNGACLDCGFEDDFDFSSSDDYWTD